LASLFDNLEIDMTLKDLRARAASIGIRIEAERFDVPVGGNFWGYWLIDEKTNNGVWDDENYCSDHQELSEALRKLEFERGVRSKAMMPF
jgi:hypothetical protein